MTVEMVKECLRKTEDVLPRVDGLFESILGVDILYDGKVRILGHEPMDREHLLKSATKRELTSTKYDEFDMDFDGVHVRWLEYRDDTNNETV